MWVATLALVLLTELNLVTSLWPATVRLLSFLPLSDGPVLMFLAPGIFAFLYLSQWRWRFWGSFVTGSAKSPEPNAAPPEREVANAH